MKMRMALWTSLSVTIACSSAEGTGDPRAVPTEAKAHSVPRIRTIRQRGPAAEVVVAQARWSSKRRESLAPVESCALSEAEGGAAAIFSEIVPLGPVSWCHPVLPVEQAVRARALRNPAKRWRRTPEQDREVAAAASVALSSTFQRAPHRPMWPAIRPHPWG